MTPLGLLLHMLTYRRPRGSATEQAFIKQFIAPLAPTPDDYGNLHIWIDNPDGTPSRMLWSCHTDTVHRVDGLQTVRYDPVTGIVELSRKARKRGSNCLGADDTAGVFLCTQMIAAQVPGHYIFHYGEESGGLGSSNLARLSPELLGNAEIAIALDRRGTSDIITHQFGSRMASQIFALSLARELMHVDPLLDYAPTQGLYTDTAEYAGIIAECSNLSVGYLYEHQDREILCTGHTLRLLRALCAIDTSALIVEREPCADDYSMGYADTDYLADAVIDPCFACNHGREAHECFSDGECAYCRCSLFVSQRPERTIYLDPVQADIQDALATAQDDLVRRYTLRASRLEK